MPLYLSRPTVVDAVRFTDASSPPPGVAEGLIGQFWVRTISGHPARILVGEWCITEPDGKSHYPCKNEVFENRYEVYREITL